jgi:hypothetical protein
MSAGVHIYLLCHNEEVLLPHAIHHYRSRIPNATITILDNESSDQSREIAKKLGCRVTSYSSGDRMDDERMKDVKNSSWKEVNDGWVIIADMDEWLCVGSSDLEEEARRGVTLLRTYGWNVVSDSKTKTLEDLDLHALNNGYHWPQESKSVCFRRPQIQEMRFRSGAHRCAPVGEIVRSRQTYLLKHMEWLGREFIVDKSARRYVRSRHQHHKGLSTHYSNDRNKVAAAHVANLRRAQPFNESPRWRPLPDAWNALSSLPLFARPVRRIKRALGLLPKK